jgi:hypothetical protein
MECVVVGTELEVSVYSRIYKAYSVRCAAGDGDVVAEAAIIVHVGTVDEPL